MKRLALLTLFLLIASSAAAGTEDQMPMPGFLGDDDCSNAVLHGDFGYSNSGTRPAPPPPSGTPNYVPGTIEQVVAVGIQTFDGEGNFTQVSTDKGSLSGILFPNRGGSGTYVVNGDCSGTTTLHYSGLPFAIVSDIVVVDRGREIHGIIASPLTVMIASTARRTK